MNDIQGYIIINTKTGMRWGSLYESTSGAKSSFNSWSKYKGFTFNEQTEYVIKPLVIYDVE